MGGTEASIAPAADARFAPFSPPRLLVVGVAANLVDGPAFVGQLEPMQTRPFDPAEIEALIALHNRVGPGGRHWGRLEAEALLLDHARGGGSQVAVVEHEGAIVGFTGWVALGEGEFYGSPVVAATPAAAEAVLRRLLAEATILGARFVRVSAFDEEGAKRAALEAAGFAPAMELVYLDRPLGSAPAEVAVPAGFTAVSPGEVDLEEFADLYNDSFAEVDNSPPVTVEIAADAWDPVHMLVGANQLWRDERGYAGFATVHREGQLEAIGVRDDLRGRGLGAALMRATLVAAAAAGLTHLESVVASSNPVSLALHRRFEFVERARATSLQLDLDDV